MFLFFFTNISIAHRQCMLWCFCQFNTDWAVLLLLRGFFKVGMCCCRTWQQHGSHKAWVQVPFRSQLRRNHQQLSCLSAKTKVLQHRSLRRRGLNMTAAFSHLKGGGGNCGVSKRTGPHRSWSDWSIFYKSSSARHEKTRPVAILSTTLQPYFRFHLNATCAVFVRTDTGEELRKKKWAEINFGGSFLRSAYLQMFLKSYR